VTREDRDRLRAERERERAARPVLGLDLQPSGSRRDTLGVLVTRVAEGGPAERAGVVEGDRVAAVNGVDLRVSRDDAGDGWVSSAKSSRFTREMQGARVGQPVELRVYSGGQFKTVRVSPARAEDVYKEGRDGGVFFRSAFGDGRVVRADCRLFRRCRHAPDAADALRRLGVRRPGGRRGDQRAGARRDALAAAAGDPPDLIAALLHPAPLEHETRTTEPRGDRRRVRGACFVSLLRRMRKGGC
jgi:hypothetical protein